MNKAIARGALLAIICVFATACATTTVEDARVGTTVVSANQAASDGLLLLGTAGGPLARPDRSGIATLLTVGGKRYLIDAGDGIIPQIGKAGLGPRDIPVVFLTHLHDDHYAGLPGLASFAWTVRGQHLDIYGPHGTADLVKGILQIMTPNARIRMAEQRFDRTPEDFIMAHEYSAGQIFDDGNVRVSAIGNTHFDLAPDSAAASDMSYSFRFETHGRSIVFTGDTGPSAAVAEFARGADILVSEMASIADREAVPPFVRGHMDREHLSPLEVGKLAAAAGVKTLVLTHIGMAGEADVAVIRSVFKGEVILGTDMTAIPL